MKAFDKQYTTLAKWKADIELWYPRFEITENGGTHKVTNNLDGLNIQAEFHGIHNHGFVKVFEVNETGANADMEIMPATYKPATLEMEVDGGLVRVTLGPASHVVEIKFFEGDLCEFPVTNREKVARIVRFAKLHVTRSH